MVHYYLYHSVKEKKLVTLNLSHACYRRKDKWAKRLVSISVLNPAISPILWYLIEFCYQLLMPGISETLVILS